MKVPSTAWLGISKNNRQWSLFTPNIKIFPHTRFYAGCMKQNISTQIESATKTKVKNAQRIRLQHNDDQTIRIGPLIGILSVARGKRLLGNRANFVDIIKTGKQLGALVFVFTPDDIEWEHMKINGRFYDPARKQWLRLTIPFPDVVYNRIPNRDYEASNKVASALLKLQQISNLHLFNPHFFNKWELYQIIQTSHLQHYLPETKLLTSPQMLIQLLQKYKKLFLKPTTGKAGRGIYMLSLDDKGIRISSSFAGTKRSHVISGIDGLWRRLLPIVTNQDYIVQQAIPLLQHQESPFDVRVLVQKNLVGEWEVSGVGYRLAGKDSITTHVPQGGKIINKALALDPHFGVIESDQILYSIKEASIQIAQTLEEHYSQLGEISMDLGITKEGKIWFFEANAKPMKFDEPDIRKTSLRRIIEYCLYLSRFT